MADYTMAQLSEIISQAHAYVEDEFNIARQHGDLKSFIEKYDVSLSSVMPQPVNRKMVILVIGDLSGKINDFVKAAKEYNIYEENLEFVSFDEIKNYNIEKLKYSFKYSDIICGPIPHKINQLNGSNSFISMLKSVPDKEAYPKLIEATSEQVDAKLKLTISSFRKALLETKLIKEIMR